MQRGRYSQLAAMAGAFAVAGWTAQAAMAAAPPATGLPAGFSAAALGTPSDTQSVSVDASGVWTIKAGGDGLTDTDSGIGVYQKLSGNGSVIAHITSISDPGAQVAVSFRADPTDEASPVLRLKYSGSDLLVPEIRRASGDSPQAASANNDSSQVGFAGLSGAGSDNVPGAGRPLGNGLWIGVDRNGPAFSFYESNDGKAWVQIARAVDNGGSHGKGETLVNDAPLYPNDMQVGIEASKSSASAVATATLDNVSVSSTLLGAAAISDVSLLPRDKSVIVAWTPVTAAGADVTYNVYSYTKPNLSDKPVKMNTDPIKDSTFMVESLSNGSTYRFGVTAVVNGVESPIALPPPCVGGGAIGVVVPNPPTADGLQLYTFGSNTPGTVTVTGTGAAAKYDFMVGGFDFWEAGDGGSILAMPMSGDLDVSLRLVQGPTDNGDGWSQGGPTFRESLDPGSRMAIAVLPSGSSNAMQFKRRFVENERPHNSSVTQSSGDDTVRPVWARLVRKGDTFTGYYAEGDKTPGASDWQPMGDPSATDDSANTSTIDGFSQTPFVGMTWTAHTEGDVAEVVVDNFVIKPAQ